jgi:hypothetical protein
MRLTDYLVVVLCRGVEVRQRRFYRRAEADLYFDITRALFKDEQGISVYLHERDAQSPVGNEWITIRRAS